MKLNVRAMAITSSVLWGGAVLTVGLINLIEPKYGRQFLNLISSIYPGYQAQPKVEGCGGRYWVRSTGWRFWRGNLCSPL